MSDPYWVTETKKEIKRRDGKIRAGKATRKDTRGIKP